MTFAQALQQRRIRMMDGGLVPGQTNEDAAASGQNTGAQDPETGTYTPPPPNTGMAPGTIPTASPPGPSWVPPPSGTTPSGGTGGTGATAPAPVRPPGYTPPPPSGGQSSTPTSPAMPAGGPTSAAQPPGVIVPTSNAYPTQPSNYVPGFGGQVDGGEAIDVNFRAIAPTITYQGQTSAVDPNAAKNTFNAQGYSAAPVSNVTAPTNTFNATQASLQQMNLAQALEAAQAQAAGQGGPAQGTLSQQGALAQQLMAQARGEGPSLAQQQLQNATQQQQQMAAGQIGSIKGINPALAARLLSQQTANLGQQAAGQSAALRLQEQQQAQGLAGNVLSQQGGLALNQQAAGAQTLGTAGGLTNAQNQLGLSNWQTTQGLNQQTAAQNAQNSLAAALANQQASQQTSLANQQAQMQAQGLNAQAASQNSQQAMQAALANQQNAYQTQALNAQIAQNNAALNQHAQDVNANIAQTNVGNDLAAQGIESGVAVNSQASNNAMISGLAGGLMQGAGALGAMALSDARAKKNIEREPTEVIPGVHRATFEYKDRPGVYEGVIAQDVEKVRPDLVVKGSDGLKRVHPSLAAHLVQQYAGGGQVRSLDSYLPNFLSPGVAQANAQTEASLRGGLGALGGGIGQAIGPRSVMPNAMEFNAQPVGPSVMPEYGVTPSSSAMTVAGPSAYGIGPFARGGEVDFRAGGKVPGKAKVEGDSERNDTVKAALSPGEIVIPRTLAQAEDAPERAKEFVAAIKRRKPMRSYGEALAAMRGA